MRCADVINISYPVLDERGNAVAALTIPYLERLEHATTPKTVRIALREASLKLTEAVGGTHHLAAPAEKKPAKKNSTRNETVIRGPETGIGNEAGCPAPESYRSSMR